VLNAQIGVTDTCSSGSPYDEEAIAENDDCVVAPIVIASTCASVSPSASVAVTVMLVGPPAVVGVPEISPVDEFSERPVGSVPDDTEYAIGAIPPVDSTVAEYSSSLAPSSNVVVVMSSGSGGAGMVNVKELKVLFEPCRVIIRPSRAANDTAATISQVPVGNAEASVQI
jgi:hypothetical protein